MRICPRFDGNCVFETAAVSQPVCNTRGTKEFSEGGSNFLNYVEHIFPGGTSPLCAPLLVMRVNCSSLSTDVFHVQTDFPKFVVLLAFKIIYY